MTTKTDTEQLRAEFEAWWESTPVLKENKRTIAEKAYQAGRAALQSQDREDVLIEVMLEACSEWSQYVEVDSAPRTLREHVQLAIDHARRIEGEAK